MSETNGIKVLALVNENSPALHALHYLKTRHYDLKISHKLMDSISVMAEFKPDVVLLSWNLKNTDIKKVHSFINNKFKVICFVIGEENNGKTTSMMLASALPNLIMPPLGGAYIHTKIQGAIQKERGQLARTTNLKRRREREVLFLGGVECKRPQRHEVPKEAKWFIKISSSNPSQQVWESIYFKDGQPKYYYFKGSQPPDKWVTGTLTDADDGVLFMSESSMNHDALVSFQSQTEEDELYESETSELENDLILNSSPALASHGSTQDNTSSVQDMSSKLSHTLLEKSVNHAIDTELSSHAPGSQANQIVGQVSHLSILVIKSARFKGYLVACRADNQSNSDLMKNVFEHLQIEMKVHGEDLTNLCDVISLEVEPLIFQDFARDRAEFLVEKTMQEKQILFAYLPVPELPKVFEQDDLNAIELSHFEHGQHLKFDVFLHMPKNQKHIRFLKSGAPLTPAAIDRLKNHEVKQLFIKKADEHSFFAYCAYKHLDIQKRSDDKLELQVANG